MSLFPKSYTTIVAQAKMNVPGFSVVYSKFLERVTIDQCSKSMITNYSRSIAAITLHFNRVPHNVSVEEINGYLFRMTVQEKQSISYFKQAVFGLRHWFRLFGMEEKAIQMPSIKKRGRHTHKIAISNHRIKSIKEGHVCFSYKDYKEKGQQKTMQLEAIEFLRRFCLHILPSGFRKIRHYGILANRNKQEIRCLQEQFEVPQTLPGKQDWKSICRERINFDVEACPGCKKGRMQRLISFDANAPPLNFYNVLIKNKKMTINDFAKNSEAGM